MIKIITRLLTRNALIILSLYSCEEKKETGMLISGYVKNIPVKKIYLTNAYRGDIFLDSCNYENGKFQFNLDTLKLPEPFLASICIKTDKNKIEQLGIINYLRTTIKDTFSNTGFMLSWGQTELYGDYNDRFHRVAMVPNKENDLLFDLKTENFGSRKNIKFINEIIRRNPCSYFLLEKLYQNKSLYLSNELNDILSLFDKSIQSNSSAYAELKQYSGFLIDKGAAFPSSQLVNFKGEAVNLVNDSTEINMLIFWASWCGPCRLEIPQLKNLRNQFPKEILTMKSISIDEDSTSWQKAVTEEGMAWQQLIIPLKDLLKVKAQFSINSVPTVIFIDKDMKEVKRYTGYNDTNITEYNNFVNEYLIKNEN